MREFRAGRTRFRNACTTIKPIWENGCVAKKTIVGAIVASLLGVCAAAADTVYKMGSTTAGNPFTFLDVNTNKIDGMPAAVTITPVRAEIVDFSIPIFPYTDADIVKKDDNTEYKTAADFAGKAIGVQVEPRFTTVWKSLAASRKSRPAPPSPTSCAMWSWGASRPASPTSRSCGTG